MMACSFVNPASFEPREFLKSLALARRLDDARYFVSLIHTKLARRDVDHLGVVRLHAKHLKNIMRGSTYAAVVESLLDGGAIERFPYSVGERSFGFRLASRFVNDKHVRIQATDNRLIRRLQRFHDQAAAERDARMKPVHRALARQQYRLRIDGEAARQTLASLPATCNPFDTQGVLIEDIERHEFHLNVGQYGRVSNNITSLKRELRQNLNVNGQPLGCVDLACAQPALLAKLIANSNNRGEGEERQGTGGRGKRTGSSKHSSSIYDSRFGHDGDVNLFTALVQSGVFYEFMVERLQGDGIGRDEVKHRILVDVIAKRGRYPSAVENEFRRLFPTVHAFIRRTNREDHANLIRELQRAESSFVIDAVAAELTERHPRLFVVSLHDALYTTAGNVPRVERAFQRAFQMTGFPMRLNAD